MDRVRRSLMARRLQLTVEDVNLEAFVDDHVFSLLAN
jgi:hypothetical protein